MKNKNAEGSKKWREANRAYVKAFDINRNKNPKRRAGLREAYANRRLKTIDYVRKHLYGLSRGQYDGLVKKQDNRCALCGQREIRKNYRTGKTFGLSVDHNHDTGKMRELLCRDCNLGLGMFSDSIQLLSKAVKYLKKHKE